MLPNMFGVTPFHAVISGRFASLFPSYNANLTFQTIDSIGTNAAGVTPLRMHAQNGHTDVV